MILTYAMLTISCVHRTFKRAIWSVRAAQTFKKGVELSPEAASIKQEADAAKEQAVNVRGATISLRSQSMC